MYIGVNNPTIILDHGKSFYDYDEANISFKNIIYDNSVGTLITKGEKLFLDGNYKEAFPFVKKSAENDNPRAMFILSLYYKHGYDFIF